MTKKEKAQQYFVKAIKAYERKDYNAARNNFEKAIRYNPNDAEAYNNLALILENHFQKYEKAKQYYEKAIEINPNDAKAYNNLALLLQNHFKDYKKAKQYFEKAIEISPDYAEAHYNFALILATYFKDYKKAKQYYEKAIEINPNYAEAYNNFASLLIVHFKDYKKAKQYFEKAIEISPDYAEAHYNFALILATYFKDYKKAKQYYEKAIEINPNYAEAYNNLAILLSQQFKDYNKAKQYSEKYQELSRINEVDYINKNSKKIKSINSISIKNYFSIKDIEIDNLKDKKEIYFLGENGDGKTILLQAIFLAFQQNYFKNYAKKTFVSEAIDVFDANKELLLKATDNNDNGFEFTNLNFAQNIFTYGVNRNRIEGDEDKYNFMTLFSNKVKLNDPSAWLQKLDYYENRKDYTSPFPLESAVKILKDILDDNIEIDVNPDDVTFTERGTPLKFEQLSDGYKSVLIWISDLIVKLAKTQPEAKSSRDFEGVVMVDEIDLHLHPKWCFSIVAKLRDWFPKIQWIFTTHSPTITLAASKDAVFYKLYKENKEIKLYQPIQNLNMTANSLLTSLLWRLDSFSTKNIPSNLISSDDYVFQKIHSVITKRIQDVPNLVDDDIMKMIEEELDKIEKE